LFVVVAVVFCVSIQAIKSDGAYSTRRPIRTGGMSPRGAVSAHRVRSLMFNDRAASRADNNSDVTDSVATVCLLSRLPLALSFFCYAEELAQ
jgi:hypothetical protein